jgi:UDP-galactopyranose mutase
LITFSSASSPGLAPHAANPADDQTLICFSHLRWNFVFQRPQHLMSRFAKERRVIYWEEPEAALPDFEPSIGVRECAETGVIVVTPSLPEHMAEDDKRAALKALLDGFLAGESKSLIRWYYTPMMLPFSRHVDAACTVYDCMDELANFRFAPASCSAWSASCWPRPTWSSPAATACTRRRRGGTRTSIRSRPASTAGISPRPATATAARPTRRRSRRRGSASTA